MNRTYFNTTGTNASILFQRIMYVYPTCYTYHQTDNLLQVKDAEHTVFTISINGDKISVATVDDSHLIRNEEDQFYQDIATILF